MEILYIYMSWYQQSYLHCVEYRAHTAALTKMILVTYFKPAGGDFVDMTTEQDSLLVARISWLHLLLLAISSAENF